MVGVEESPVPPLLTPKVPDSVEVLKSMVKPVPVAPAVKVPVPVIAVATASLVSTRAAFLPSRRSSSVEEIVVAVVVMSLLPMAMAVAISASVKSMAVVIPPAADWIVKPIGWTRSASKLSISNS